MEGGSFTVDGVESNAIECEKGPIIIYGGQLNLQSVNDAISASYEVTDNTINPQITIAGGLLKLVTSCDKAMGIKAEGDYTQTGGLIKAQVSGAGSKGIDSNGTITITVGLVVSSEAGTPEEGFDCDNNAFTVLGGTFIGAGGSTSSPTSVKQSVVRYGGSGSAGALMTISSSDGSIVGSYVIPRAYSQMTILFSSPSFISGNSYTLSIGGTVTPTSEEATFYGLTTNGSITGAISLSTFTASSTAISTIGTVSNSMGGGFGGLKLINV